jgi:hypothetical protein
MTQDHSRKVLRLPRKHAAKTLAPPNPADGERLAREQSVRNAIMAGLVVIIVYSSAWALLSTTIQRVYPWLTVLQGALIGLAVRRAGRGLDWKFPTIAAVLAVIGALAGSVVVAAAFTAAEFDTGTITILRGVTAMTWPVFFDEVMTPADAVFALFGAAAAAFYANRRLNRAQYLALRTWQEKDDRG